MDYIPDGDGHPNSTSITHHNNLIPSPTVATTTESKNDEIETSTNIQRDNPPNDSEKYTTTTTINNKEKTNHHHQIRSITVPNDVTTTNYHSNISNNVVPNNNLISSTKTIYHATKTDIEEYKTNHDHDQQHRNTIENLDFKDECHTTTTTTTTTSIAATVAAATKTLNPSNSEKQIKCDNNNIEKNITKNIIKNDQNMIKCTNNNNENENNSTYLCLDIGNNRKLVENQTNDLYNNNNNNNNGTKCNNKLIETSEERCNITTSSESKIHINNKNIYNEHNKNVYKAAVAPPPDNNIIKQSDNERRPPRSDKYMNYGDINPHILYNSNSNNKFTIPTTTETSTTTTGGGGAGVNWSKDSMINMKFNNNHKECENNYHHNNDGPKLYHYSNKIIDEIYNKNISYPPPPHPRIYDHKIDDIELLKDNKYKILGNNNNNNYKEHHELQNQHLPLPSPTLIGSTSRRDHGAHPVNSRSRINITETDLCPQQQPLPVPLHQPSAYNYHPPPPPPPPNTNTFLPQIYNNNNKTVNEETEKQRQENYSNKSEEEVTSSYIEHTKYINHQAKKMYCKDKEYLLPRPSSGNYKTTDNNPTIYSASAVPSSSVVSSGGNSSGGANSMSILESDNSTKYQLLPSSHNEEYTKNNGKSEKHLMIPTLKTYDNSSYLPLSTKSDSFIGNKIQKYYNSNEFVKETPNYSKFDNKINSNDRKIISGNNLEIIPSTNTHGQHILPIKNTSYTNCNENINYPPNITTNYSQNSSIHNNSMYKDNVDNKPTTTTASTTDTRKYNSTEFNIYPNNNNNIPSTTRPREEYSSLLQNRLYSNSPNYCNNNQKYEQQKVVMSSTTPTTDNKQLSKLHMNPPDFTKQTVTAHNFKEISEKYNYIKDLRLKNPGYNDSTKYSTSKFQEPDDKRHLVTQNYNNLYVKTPDFSAENLSKATEKQIHHYPLDNFNINSSRTPISSSSSTTTIHVPNEIYTRKYPQLSHDVEMSVVPKNKHTEQFHSAAAHPLVVGGKSQLETHLNEGGGGIIERFHSSAIHVNQSGTNTSKKQQKPYQSSTTNTTKIKSCTPPNNQSQIENTGGGVVVDRRTSSSSSYVNYRRENNNIDDGGKNNIKSCVSVIQSRTDQGLINSPGNSIHNNIILSPQQPVSTNWHNNQYDKPSSHRKQCESSPHNNLINNNSTVAAGVSVSSHTHMQNSQIDTTINNTTTTTSDCGIKINTSTPWQTNEKLTKSGHHMKSTSTPHHQAHSSFPITFAAHNPVFSPQSQNSSSPSPITTTGSVNFERPYSQPEFHAPSYYKSNTYSPQHHPQAISGYYMENKDRMNIPFGGNGKNDIIDLECNSSSKLQQFSERKNKSELAYHLGMPHNTDQKTISKRIECTKNYPNQQHPVQFPSAPHSQQLPIPKRSIETQNNTKVHSKPNYREMINNYCATRTSENELNLEIIKRTLNRDVSLHKFDSDLSKNIFDSPIPTKNNLPSNAGRSSLYSNHEAKKSKIQHNNIEFEKRKPNYADTTSDKTLQQTYKSKKHAAYNLPIESPRNDISVTVSKVLPNIADRSQFVDRPLLHSMLENTKPVVGKINERNDKSVVSSCKPTSVYAHQNNSIHNINTGKIVSASPLDLSVKTIKTKADSTGCDDTKAKQKIRNSGNLHSAPKVDFSPNFANTCRQRSDTNVRLHMMTSFADCQINNKNSTTTANKNSTRKNDEMLPPAEKKPLPYKLISTNNVQEISRQEVSPNNYPANLTHPNPNDIESSSNQFKINPTPPSYADKFLNSTNFEKNSNHINLNKLPSQFHENFHQSNYEQSYSALHTNRIINNECPTTSSSSDNNATYMNYPYNIRDDGRFNNYSGKIQRSDIIGNTEENNTIRNTTHKLTYNQQQPADTYSSSRYHVPVENETINVQNNTISISGNNSQTINNRIDKTTINYPNITIPSEKLGKQKVRKIVNQMYKADLDHGPLQVNLNPNFRDKCSTFIDEKRITSVIQTGKSAYNNNNNNKANLGYIHSTTVQQQPEIWSPPPPITMEMNHKQQITDNTGESERNFSQNNDEKQKLISAIPSTAATLTLSKNVSGNNSGNLKSADQKVISKLRNGIEIREYEKQKQSTALKDTCCPEDSTKTDIASILAARIRTKGELKVFNPTPPVMIANTTPTDSCFSNIRNKRDTIQNEVVPTEENNLALDMLSWGSACNDFVEQLKCGENKKRVKKCSIGADGGGATDKLLEVELNPNSQDKYIENTTVVDTTVTEKPIKIKNSDSSDEDKPLQQLRQLKQNSINDNLKCIKLEPSNPANNINVINYESIDSNKTKQNSIVEKLGRNIREKRIEQEKRLAARLGKQSSSDSEDKKQISRPKKLKKPRSRLSNVTSTKEISETDSSGAEELSMTRNLVRSRAESRKRKFNDSDKEISDSKRFSSIKKSMCNNTSKIEVCERKEILTKAEMKFMAPTKQSIKSTKPDNSPIDTTTIDRKHQTDEPCSMSFSGMKKKKLSGSKSSSNKISKIKASKNKISKLSKKSSKSQIQDKEIYNQETMTRSKKRKEIEKQIANSKILRNDKVIRNIFMDRKLKASENQKLKKLKGYDRKITKYRSNRNLSNSDKNLVQDSKDGTTDIMYSSVAESEIETVSDRLRSRKYYRFSDKNKKRINKTTLKNCKTRRNKTTTDYKTYIGKSSLNKTRKFLFKKKQAEAANNCNLAKFPPGWEDQVYEYKKSLKVPLSLITIKGPPGHRISTSLPDLDSHSSDENTENYQHDKNNTNIKTSKNLVIHKNSTKNSNNKKLKTQEKPPLIKEVINKEDDCKLKTERETSEKLSPKSIIDVLHSRVIKSKNITKPKVKTSNNTESKILVKGNNELEMFPSPLKCSSESVTVHHNVFDTEVLKSRTRTESRNLKNKELIREVFGGEDRPASAPPEIQKTAVESVTFEEKYEQYLKKMNVDFGDKISKIKKPLQPSSTSYLLTKYNENITSSRVNCNTDDDNSRFSTNHDDASLDTVIKMSMQDSNSTSIKDEVLDPNRETLSAISEMGSIVTPFSIKSRKGTKYRTTRRKGSSGFDYIRKKKKPQTITSGVNNQEIIKRKKLSPVEFLHSRNENDVSREIQKWVLNKSVGQSALHKAARLGYLDVIVYCLERMGMNPDPKDNAGYTPLHEACSKGRIDIARVLLQYGANHSETAHSGIRPLHEASENGYIEIVRLLLSYGADPLLTTYSGQTPLMLAENNEMEQFIKNHLYDVQNTGPHKQPWKLPGPWKLFDPDENGFNILDAWNEDFDNFDKVENLFDTSNNSKCDENSTNWNIISSKNIQDDLNSKCCIRIDEKLTQKNNMDNNNDEIFELEEADVPLPPLYLLKDEGSEKWVLLNDLCNILKVKSKETLMKQICPSTPSSIVNKALLRELKMSDFLEKATCLQLLCAGEKINVRASKVILVKYNEKVQTLLGVRTIVMKF